MDVPPAPISIVSAAVPVVDAERRRRNIGLGLLLFGCLGVALATVLPARMPGDPPLPAPTTREDAPTQRVQPSAPPEEVQAPASPVVPTAPAEPVALAVPTAPATSSNDRITAPAAPVAPRPTRQATAPPTLADANAPGALFAISRPIGAQLFVDDVLVGTTPLLLPRLSAGSHRIRLELPGFQAWSSSVQIEPNQRFRLAAQLEP